MAATKGRKDDTEMAIKRIVEHLKQFPDGKVIFMVGAGISTACGIPDFRSPKTGLYHNLSKLKLPYAEAVFDVTYFEENPRPFYMLAKELYPGNFKPSKFHYLMKVFEEKNKLRRIYTQNIDTLERQALINAQYVIEAHGSFAANHCIGCDKKFPIEAFKDKLQLFENNKAGKAGKLAEFEYATCDVCKSLVKPHIVFFGEGLPQQFFDTWDEDLVWLNKEKDKGHLIIVAGTSLTVYPFATLPSEVPKHISRALCNIGLVGDFESSPRKSDIIFDGSSEEAAQSLADKLGWSGELARLIDEDGKASKINDITATEEVVEISEELKNLNL